MVASALADVDVSLHEQCFTYLQLALLIATSDVIRDYKDEFWETTLDWRT